MHHHPQLIQAVPHIARKTKFSKHAGGSRESTLYNEPKDSPFLTQNQKELNSAFNSKRNPLGIMKPLQPSPLDDYDKAIGAERTHQRAKAGSKWVIINRLSSGY